MPGITYLLKMANMKIFLFVFILGLISCGKPDETKPVISVTAPVENQVFTGGHPISVKADISDNVNLHMVMVMVMDNTGGHMLHKDFHPDTRTFTLNEAFQTINGKTYTIHIEAADHNENKIMKDVTVSTN